MVLLCQANNEGIPSTGLRLTGPKRALCQVVAREDATNHTLAVS